MVKCCVQSLNNAMLASHRSLLLINNLLGFAMLSDEYRYKILKRLEAEPEISQRELAKELGISVGKANYCLKALIEKGLVKANNFRNNQNKKGYIYLLTTSGVEEKARMTIQFLKSKMAEYEALKGEIENLKCEAERILSLKDDSIV